MNLYYCISLNSTITSYLTHQLFSISSDIGYFINYILITYFIISIFHFFVRHVDLTNFSLGALATKCMQISVSPMHHRLVSWISYSWNLAWFGSFYSSVVEVRLGNLISRTQHETKFHNHSQSFFHPTVASQINWRLENLFSQNITTNQLYISLTLLGLLL